MNDEIYYHASQICGLSILKPHISNHGVPLVYLSKNRENVLVYLSDTVENYCKKTEDREYKPLEEIKDNYPKYVMTTDRLKQMRNGIIHYNIMKFMIEEKQFNGN